MFVLAALLLVLVALAVQNTRPVEVSWVFGTGQVPLVWLIIFSAILGWLVGMVTGTVTAGADPTGWSTRTITTTLDNTGRSW